MPEEEREYLRQLCNHEPTIAIAYELAQDCAEMARERKGQAFDAWLTRVTTSGITELKRFARGLVEDRTAVEAGLTLEWSNGRTEGQVNKLKLLKRQMYGRANFDLLRPRASSRSNIGTMPNSWRVRRMETRSRSSVGW